MAESELAAGKQLILTAVISGIPDSVQWSIGWQYGTEGSWHDIANSGPDPLVLSVNLTDISAGYAWRYVITVNE